MRPCSARIGGVSARRELRGRADRPLHLRAGDGGGLALRRATHRLTVPAAGFPSGSINAGADRLLYARPALRTLEGHDENRCRSRPRLTSMCLPAPAIWSGPTAFAEAVRVGLFDGATVELDRFFAPPQAAGSGAARYQSRRSAVVLRPGRRVRGRPQPDRDPGQVADESAGSAADAAPPVSGQLQSCVRRCDVRL